MIEIDIADATAPLSEYIRETSKGAIVVTKRGKPLAALIDVSDADRETVSLSTNPRFLAILERSRARMEREGGISSDEMRRRLGLKPRARRRRPAASGCRQRSKSRHPAS